MLPRPRPLALVGSLLVVLVLGNGCLCVDTSEKETPQDKLQRCLDRCSSARYSCQNDCIRDDMCTRACVSAYDKCIDICADKR